MKAHASSEAHMIAMRATAHGKPELSMLSNRIQNDAIMTMGTYVRKTILNETRAAKIYSFLMDETTDISHTEQASMCVRYVHDDEIKKLFIEVCDVESTTDEELETLTLAFLDRHLEIEDMRGQEYDGAANMSGAYRGLQSGILMRNEKALMSTAMLTA
ncbi:Zinc finger MYM-type protein 1 [Chionoecetes opilio]|uniref:Zinc finger MYM-type protein 1 n=1 Tax=Chionoecetes opilio TaxID=41210 RepID=A0A8J4XXF8_CHIOP|nr:Zinc finger MYM-type protein 1 [Chionoecetes opilio]